jgi:hypothetical protein
MVDKVAAQLPANRLPGSAKPHGAEPSPRPRRYGYKPAPLASLPPELGLPDGTVQEVMRFRNESARTVWRKITDGTYQSYKDRDRRLILWSSVLADRARCIEAGPQLSEPPSGKRRVGRPPKAGKVKNKLL